MKTTADKPTTTASAPPEKVRTYIDNEREPGLRNYIETGRTIPAEKPTMDIFQQWYENARAGRDKAQAHADKLAEALRELRDTHVKQVGMWTDPKVRQADAVLKAYEDSR